MRRSIGFFSVMLVLALPVLPACGCLGPDGKVHLCEGYRGGGPTGPIVHANVAGTWDLGITVTGGTQAPAGTEFSATFTLAQSGTDVTGTFAGEGGLSGQLTGTVSGLSFRFFVAQDQPCPGNFDGVGSVASSLATMSGAYTGMDCGGDFGNVFQATKR